MNILVFNQDWFVERWRKAGHTVVTCGQRSNMDVRFDEPTVALENLINRIGNNFKPDRLVLLDNSAPFAVTGFEQTTVPALFYSVDIHHHFDLHRYYPNLFDVTLVAQKDYLPQFEALGHSPIWIPLWASRRMEPSSDKQFGVVFVGTLNEKLNPDRVKFFEDLRRLVPIEVRTGAWWDIFPKAELVINQTVKGDLNFRVFEAMMSGACLLTEDSGNGFREFFKPNEHLLVYEKGNVQQAADIIKGALADLPRTRRIAEAGRAEVLARHCQEHRAATVLGILEGLEKRENSQQKYFAAMANFAALGNKLGKTQPEVAGSVLEEALRLAEQGLKAGEKMEVELACLLVSAALRFDHYQNSGRGAAIFSSFAKAYPEISLFAFGQIHTHLRGGERAAAERIAEQISDTKPSELFAAVDAVLSGLLDLT